MTPRKINKAKLKDIAQRMKPLGMIFRLFPALLLFLFACQPALDYGYSKKRPQGFPAYLIVPDYAKDVLYDDKIWGVSSTVGFNIPKGRFDDAKAFLHDQFRSVGFSRLKYDFIDPGKPLSNKWVYQTVEFKGEKVSSCSYLETWLDLSASPPKWLKIGCVVGDRFNGAHERRPYPNTTDDNRCVM